IPQTYVAPKPVRKPAAKGPELGTVPAVAEAPATAPESVLLLNELGDDRDRLQAGDRVVLIIDNDENFARFLLDLAHEHGCKALVALSGAGGIALAREFQPDAITLDIRLPDIDGWKVLSRLKNDLSVRQIPVHVISTDEQCENGLRRGAGSVRAKPIKSKETLDAVFDAIHRDLERAEREVLVITTDPDEQAGIAGMLDGADLRVRVAGAPADELGACDAVIVGSEVDELG